MAGVSDIDSIEQDASDEPSPETENSPSSQADTALPRADEINGLMDAAESGEDSNSQSDDALSIDADSADDNHATNDVDVAEDNPSETQLEAVSPCLLYTSPSPRDS